MLFLKEKFFSLDCEQVILSRCLSDETDKVLVLCIRENIFPEFFIKPEHQILFQIFLKFFYKNIRIDITSLLIELQENCLLNLIGGTKYLIFLRNKLQSFQATSFYIDKLKSLFFFRKVRALALKIIEVVDSITTLSLKKFISIIERKISHLKNLFKPATILQGKSVLNKVVRGFNKDLFLNESLLKNSEFTTGFHDLDKFLYSIKGGDLCIIAARPGLGKTSLSLNIVENVISKTIKAEILFFSLEMTSEQLLSRLLSSVSRIDLHSIKKGNLNKFKFRALCKSIDKIKNFNLWVDDTSYLNISDIKSKVKKFTLENNLNLIVVDYIQLIDSINFNFNREQQISHISRTLKNIAKEFKVPVIALSQLNRESEKNARSPKLSDLRESGSIEQDADSVIIITNYLDDSKYQNELHIRKLLIAKNRNGPTGELTLIFNSSITRFEDHFEKRKIRKKK
jgi:replicative DNA helicase